MKLIEEKMAQLSTAHYTYNDDKLLTEEAKADKEPMLHGIGVYANGFGFFLCICDDPNVGSMFSVAFKNIIDMAISQNLSHIRFDSDAPIQDGLETFDW